MLAQNVPLWKTIHDGLKLRGGVGSAITFRCQNHPQTECSVSEVKDFDKVPEGGCTKPCDARLDCGHVCQKACHVGEHTEYCLKPCPVKLECGHPCTNVCFEECIEECQVPVQKTHPICGHTIQVPCHVDILGVSCTHPVLRKMPTCGHTEKVECGKTDDQVVCPAPCGKLLDCEHICAGSCGRCHEGRLHVKCVANCGRLLVCSHPCSFPCTKNCPPCKRKCENQCFHGKCKKNCGDLCVKCTEPCKWACPHYTCKELCGNVCVRPRCDQPCKKTLKCKHPCMGMCGELCSPDLCVICNPSIKEILFGTEDEPGARFVQLQDCKHVFEVTMLDHFMDSNDSSSENNYVIKLKECPRCKTPIRRSLRYGNSVKQALADIEQVKRKMKEVQDAIDKSCKELDAKIVELILAKEIPGNFQVYYNMIKGRLLERLTTDDVTTAQNQFALLPFFIKLDKMHTELAAELELAGLDVEKVVSSSVRRKLLEDMMQRHVTERQFNDISHIINTMAVRADALKLLYSRSVKLTPEQRAILVDVEAQLSKGVTEDRRRTLKEKVDEIKKQHQQEVTKEERAMIHRAMGLGQGHWFKCPNGHIYAIGDCGGAMQESKCNECGASIGGGNHTLRRDNTHTSDMDGSRHAAWSDAANNMGNWDLGQE